MSAYMVLPVQQSVVASLALRFNRVKVLDWIKSKPAMTFDFESEAHRLVNELTHESSDADIIKALVCLFSATNFHNIASLYGKEAAIRMACASEGIEGLDFSAEEASKDPDYMPKIVLKNYIDEAITDLEREPVQALINTTSKPQYLMWFANLRYQACDFDDFSYSVFSKFFKKVAGKVDTSKPNFKDCEWSLSRI